MTCNIKIDTISENNLNRINSIPFNSLFIHPLGTYCGAITPLRGTDCGAVFTTYHAYLVQCLAITVVVVFCSSSLALLGYSVAACPGRLGGIRHALASEIPAPSLGDSALVPDRLDEVWRSPKLRIFFHFICVHFSCFKYICLSKSSQPSFTMRGSPTFSHIPYLHIPMISEFS